MLRTKYIRLFVLLMVVSVSLVLFSYVRGRSAGVNDSDPNCDGSKCPSGKVRTEFILWESLTHNLLVSNK
jgi:hypothetical protein